MIEKRNSFKSTLLAIIAFLVCFVPVSMFLTINTPSGKFKAVACGIEYKIYYEHTKDNWSVEDNPLTSDYWQPAFKTDGNYPTSYISGEETIIDDLKSSFIINRPNNGGDSGYKFKGWYLDEECTIPFDGVITADMTGDITIYAFIECTYFATGNY